MRFCTVEEFLEELGLEAKAPSATLAPRILRLTCTYTQVQGQALSATVVAGVMIHQQLIELQQYCGNVWDMPGDPDAPKARGKPVDETTHAKVTAVLSAVVQFATAHAWGSTQGDLCAVGWASRLDMAAAHQRGRSCTRDAARRVS